jgi:phage protein D
MDLGALLGGGRREPAECVLRVGHAGQEITELYPYLTEVRVDTARDRAGTASLVFESRRDESGHWLVQDAGVFAPWEPVVVTAAFGSTTEEVLRGYVRQVAAGYPEDPGATTVTVTVQDDSLALDREQVRTVWGGEAPTTDQGILASILGKHGLALDPESATGQSGLVLNQNATDARFLAERAAANGFELIFDRGSVYFGPMRVDGERQPTIKVYAGPDTNCLRFDVSADGHQPEQVAFDAAAESGAGSVEHVVAPTVAPLGTTPATGPDAGLPPFVWRLDRLGGASVEQTTARAEGRANELAMRVRAEGELEGTCYGHVLRIGRPVGVDGVGEWLGGTYYVDAVRHRFGDDGYHMAFTLLRNAYGDDLAGLGGSALAGLL